MKSVFALTAFAAFALLVPSVSFADSVTINNTTYTCTNSCVVTTNGSSYTVRDCCGGRVSVIFGKIEE